MTRVSKASIRVSAAILGALLVGGSASAAQVDPPKPGVSKRIDAIRERGTLRVGAMSDTPYLFQETTGGSGDGWSGPAWVLAKSYADQLGVKIEVVQVSNETKVPVITADQVDMTIAPLATTEERKKIIDFVVYSNTAVCMYGLESNPKFSGAKTVDDLNNANVTIAYFTGSAEESWVQERFPLAQKRSVIGSGATPIEEILSGRADTAPVNRTNWISMSKKLSGGGVLPSENNCQDTQEKAQDVGLGIAKDQPEYAEWLRAVAASEMESVKTEEQRLIAQ